ncbi:MAG: hypothetical protein ACHREM_16490 [Polyangiales bacterium]
MVNAKKPAMRVSQTSVAKDEATKIGAVSTALGLGKAMSVAKKRAAVSGMNVSDDFLETAAQIYDKLGAATGVTSFNSDAVRTAIAFRKSQTVVLSAAQALVTLLEERTLSTYGDAGNAALDLYAELKAKARRNGAKKELKDSLKSLSDEMAKYRRAAAARKKAAREANQLKRAEAKAAKAGATAGRKAAKSGGSTK